VANGLRQSLADGRHSVSMIVGRDPESLDEAGVARAAIESAAENFSDGVVAPIFWYAVAGLPGIAAYKIVNTADSMIGHCNDRYLEFGWASARLDDVLNVIPARLTGFLFAAVSGNKAAVPVMFRDAPGHRSPNAGWPESAMAALLGVALAGPRQYGDQVVDDPYMNAEGRREATADDIYRAISILWRAWFLMLGLAIAYTALFWRPL
ncbi:MAG: CobD/CbiB family cobalamin biosynthesis protein, partial [Pseudomonadota bacterium]